MPYYIICPRGGSMARVTANLRSQGSAEQLRCSVPDALRTPAPPEPRR